MKNLLILILLSCTSLASDPLPTADYVDVKKYIGKWYAIAALPQFFTRKCEAQTAEYDIRDESSITVLNTCYKDQKVKKTIDGQAVISNSATNAELIVSFNNFWTRLFRVRGDYIIMSLDKDYKYVLVGNKSRKGLWIMSRSTTMPEKIYKAYLKIAASNGFKVEKLIVSKF